MDTLGYYQFIETLNLEEFAPGAYKFYALWPMELIEDNRTVSIVITGMYIRGILAFSNSFEIKDNVADELKKIIEDKIIELKETEKE